MTSFERIEQDAFKIEKTEIKEKMLLLNKQFSTKLAPENGVYGITEVIKENGVLERIGKNELGHTFKEYYLNNKIYLRRESYGKGTTVNISFDDNETAYLRRTTLLDNHKARTISFEITPDITICKNNFTSVIDSYGRPVLNKVTDLEFNSESRANIQSFRDSSYNENDQVSHIIAHFLGGPDSKENLVAQLDKVNLGKMKKVENVVKELKQSGHKVDYEVKTNYVGSNKRPSSFEPKITVDGKEYLDLPEDLKKIYNDSNGVLKHKVVNVGEKYGLMHEKGIESAKIAAGLTLAVSTVDNLQDCFNGEITGEEAALNIIKETGASAGLAYGTTFVTTGITQSMKSSSKILFNKIGNSCLPAMAVTFAVDSYDIVSDYASGEIDEKDLLYGLGDSAASVAGGAIGANVGGIIGATIGTAVAPGAGTAVGKIVGNSAGAIVGGMVGAALASETYATAVELGEKGAEIAADKAKEFATDTIDFVKENMPDSLDDVKTAFNDFFESNHIPISINM